MIDANEIGPIEARLKSSSKKLHQLAPSMGMAKQIKSYDGDRRKNLLAKYVVVHLKAGESATASEAQARATPAYQTELEQLAANYQDAERTIAEYDAEYASFEAARSLLSFARESLRNLEG